MSAPEMLAIGLPTLSVLVGILLNRNDVARLDARINTLQTYMNTEFSSVRQEFSKTRDDIRSIRDDQREFYRTLGQHEVRLDKLDKD